MEERQSTFCFNINEGTNMTLCILPGSVREDRSRCTGSVVRDMTTMRGKYRRIFKQRRGLPRPDTDFCRFNKKTFLIFQCDFSMFQSIMIFFCLLQKDQFFQGRIALTPGGDNDSNEVLSVFKDHEAYGLSCWLHLYFSVSLLVCHYCSLLFRAPSQDLLESSF